MHWRGAVDKREFEACKKKKKTRNGHKHKKAKIERLGAVMQTIFYNFNRLS